MGVGLGLGLGDGGLGRNLGGGGLGNGGLGAGVMILSVQVDERFETPAGDVQVLNVMAAETAEGVKASASAEITPAALTVAYRVPVAIL